jgi:hypothetical protein
MLSHATPQALKTFYGKKIAQIARFILIAAPSPRARLAPHYGPQRARGQAAPKTVPVPIVQLAGWSGASSHRPSPSRPPSSAACAGIRPAETRQDCELDPPQWWMPPRYGLAHFEAKSWRTVGVLTPTPGEAQLTAACASRFAPADADAVAERCPLPALSAPGTPAPHQGSPPCAWLAVRARGERRPRR